MMVVIGVDVGSVFTKALLMADGDILSHFIMPSGGDFGKTSRQAVEKTAAAAGFSLSDVAAMVATGYGAANFPLSRDTATDIACQGRGIIHRFPSVRTIIDIGGQASKAIRINDKGRATDFVISEKCAAGSGRFLQVIARVLQINLEDIGELSLKSKNPVTFSTSCAVFNESEAISRIAEGALKEDILAGVHNAIAIKAMNLLDRVGLDGDCAVTGGGAEDVGLVQTLQEKAGVSLKIPEQPQLTAALGAALLAGEKNNLAKLDSVHIKIDP